MNLTPPGCAVKINHPRTGVHMWVILTEEDASGRVLAVMVCTRRAHSDCTVILSVGDHEFIVRESVVDYGSTTPMRTSQLRAWLSSGRAELMPSISRLLLRRVLDGVCRSGHTPNDVKRDAGCP